jgi:hypothetical protein
MGLIAQPLHALAFGSWLPLEHPAHLHLGGGGRACACEQSACAAVAGCRRAADVRGLPVGRRWRVLLAWIAFRHRAWWLLLVALAAVCWANHNGWALLAVPVVLLAARVPWQLPRWRWMFYGYYVGHLAVLALVAHLLA